MWDCTPWFRKREPFFFHVKTISVHHQTPNKDWEYAIPCPDADTVAGLQLVDYICCHGESEGFEAGWREGRGQCSGGESEQEGRWGESCRVRGEGCAQHWGNGGAQPSQKLCLRCYPPRSLSMLTLLGPRFFENGLTLLLMPYSKLKGSIVVYSRRWVSREKRCDDFGKEKKLNWLAISPEMPFPYCKSKTH